MAWLARQDLEGDRLGERLGTPGDHSVPERVSLMLRHATESIAVQLVKLMRWSPRAQVKSGPSYGIPLWATWPNVCQMLVRLHSTVIVLTMCLLASDHRAKHQCCA